MKIAVIGAGIGGLAVARALALRGAQVTVLEQSEAIREVGAGLQISPNGAAVLRGLGLDPAGIGQKARAINLLDHTGRPALRLDLARQAATRPSDYYFCHRADLICALAESARTAGVRIRLLQKVKEVIPGTPPEILVCNTARLHPDLVIGADGLHSCLRNALLGDSRAGFTGQVAWRAVVPLDSAPTPEVRLHMGPGRHLVTYPLRQGALMNIVAVEERAAWTPDGWSHADDPGNLRRAFAGFPPEIRQLLARVTETNLWGLHRHPVAPRWTAGNCALLGDAAHPTLPFMAQGANLALEDAWVLAESLATGLAAGRRPADALRHYEQARVPRIRRAIEAANRNAWKYHLRFPPLRAVAHTALRLSDRLAPDLMLRQFDWLYGHDVTGGHSLV
ncbi:3-hydroxybenzoate 6-hydroxylase 1 [Pseudooceanicola algae]|uniref:3-hydroxybenzoate 6-hydroxylase 1 n=2 Tax=Pseudooceanicola algae TaxID=1537215 RepID=A0A418SDM1_9RHOB|nr:FAD-dependent monooxygenase [Pseudooceanicola algae]QPM89446.1 3-hydroxybenzoate 6-hydroxylase 1 [Pseudooceanicola algae]